MRGVLGEPGHAILPRLLAYPVARLTETLQFYRTVPPREQVVTALVLFTGIFLGILGYFAVQRYYINEARQEFERPAAKYTAVVGKTIDRYVESVNSVGAFFAASNVVDRWEFFEFTRDSLPRFPGVKALQWIPKVTQDQREAYEKRAVEDGIFGFRFTERNPSGLFATAPLRSEYYPVYYVEPFEGNEVVLGWDVGSEVTELEVLNLARDVGTMVAVRSAGPTLAGQPLAQVDEAGAAGTGENGTKAAGPSDSAQSGEGEAAARAGGGTAFGGAEFTLVLPIYQTDQVPATIKERRENLAGFARAIFRIDEMLAANLPALTVPPGLDIYIYDAAAVGERRLLYFHPSPLRAETPVPLSEAEARQGLFTETSYGLADWRWTVVARPVASELAANGDTAAWGVWAITMLFTMLVLQYMISSQTRTQTIESSVTQRTAELSAANDALETQIQERLRVEQALRAAKEQAEVANRAKSEFLAMMSHELRTPLNAVIGFAELLAQESLGPIGNKDYVDYAEDIRLSGTHLLSLINDILDLSKIEANRFELNEDVIDVADTLRSVAPILQEKINRGQLTVVTEFPPSQPGLRADQRALRQVLINLLSNAVKFTLEGGRITVKADVQADGSFLLTVEDTGIGIAENDIERVLEPFNQVDSRLSRKYEGTGLGLPLSKRLMELHGGTLTVESVLGCGTTVALWFPKERVVPSRRHQAQEPEQAPERPPEPVRHEPPPPPAPTPLVAPGEPAPVEPAAVPPPPLDKVGEGG